MSALSDRMAGMTRKQAHELNDREAINEFDRLAAEREREDAPPLKERQASWGETREELIALRAELSALKARPSVSGERVRRAELRSLQVQQPAPVEPGNATERICGYVDASVDCTPPDLPQSGFRYIQTTESVVAQICADVFLPEVVRARLQIVEDHIRDLRCENAQLRGDLDAAYCRMDDMEGLNND